MGRVPFELSHDGRDRAVNKFLDAFESCWVDGVSETKYYGDVHPDGHFVIRKHENAGTENEHLTFSWGTAPERLDQATWSARAARTYVEYDRLDELYNGEA